MRRRRHRQHRKWNRLNTVYSDYLYTTPADDQLGLQYTILGITYVDNGVSGT